MLTLDTNMLSAMMSAVPVRKVVDWIIDPAVRGAVHGRCLPGGILFGIAVLPKGGRRVDLAEVARPMFAEDFQRRVPPFDDEAAAAYAEMFGVRGKAGRSAGTVDLMLAAIASVQGAGVVTRNVADFKGVGLTIINPWDD